MHTYLYKRDIIITVKTPQYIIYFFTIPHSKIPSPKKTVDRLTVFFFAIFYTKLHVHEVEGGGLLVILLGVNSNGGGNKIKTAST